MRKKLGVKFHTCMVAFAVGIALFLGTNTLYFSGAGVASPPSYERSIGVPASPWLVEECRDIQTSGELACGDWAPSLKLASWSWLILIVSVGAGIIGLRIAGNNGAET
jgi:hypothetical protein